MYNQAPAPTPPEPAPNQPLVNYTFPIINASDIKEISTDIGGKKIPFQFIVLLNDSLSSNNTTFNQSLQALTTITESLGGEVIYTYNSSIPGFAFKAPNQQISDIIIGILKVDPRVKYIEQDQTIVPFESNIPKLTPIDKISTGIERIRANSLFNNSEIKSFTADVDIAIIDTGIDLHHPNLNVYRNVTTIVSQNAVKNTNEKNKIFSNNINLNKIGLNATNNATTIFYPPFSKDIEPTASDKCGHGTHVAGIAAAKENNVGIVGIAPGARLWDIKVIDFNNSTGKCEGTISSVIAAINYVNKNANEIDAVNLSFGCKCNSTALDKTIEASLSKNIPYVVAAGNSHSNASYFTPANNSGVITVSAIADFDGKCGAKAEGQMVKAGNFSGSKKMTTLLLPF